jgi:hypothetical protein
MAQHGDGVRVLAGCAAAADVVAADGEPEPPDEHAARSMAKPSVTARATAVLTCMIGTLPRHVVATQRPFGLSDPCAILGGVNDPDAKADLIRYLQIARNALLWKLEGVSEYDVRRPLVPTGTNLLGLVKHVASVEAGYFGETFGRPFGEPLPWLDDDAEPNADMWATAEESRDDIVGLYRRVWAHSDATIEALPLDATGHVAWWPPDRSEVTLHRILIHMIAETDRHAGHADIVRELIDGTAGLRPDNDNLPDFDQTAWHSYRDRLEAVARDAVARSND